MNRSLSFLYLSLDLHLRENTARFIFSLFNIFIIIIAASEMLLMWTLQAPICCADRLDLIPSHVSGDNLLPATCDGLDPAKWWLLSRAGLSCSSLSMKSIGTEGDLQLAVRLTSAKPGAECPASITLASKIQMCRTKAPLTYLPRGEFSCLTFALYNQ